MWELEESYQLEVIGRPRTPRCPDATPVQFPNQGAISTKVRGDNPRRLEDNPHGRVILCARVEAITLMIFWDAFSFVFFASYPSAPVTPGRLHRHFHVFAGGR